MENFQLFRFRLVRPSQKSLLYEERPPAKELVKAIREKPSAELYKGSIWHIGNIHEIGDNGLYFRVGRERQAHLDKFDEERGDFIDRQSDVAPYSDAILDIPLQLCAIGSNTEVANTIEDIASRLTKLLEHSSVGAERDNQFVAAPLKNPQSFISEIRAAERVTRFSVTFSPPNLIDAHRDFLGPFSDYADATNATAGEAEVEGNALDNDALEEISRAAAATGEDARARLIPEDGSDTVDRTLRDNPARLEGQADTREGQLNLLQRMREMYEEIRSQESDG